MCDRALGDRLLSTSLLLPAELLLDPALGVRLLWDLLASLGVGLHLMGEESLETAGLGLLRSGEGVLGAGVGLLGGVPGSVGLFEGVTAGSDLRLSRLPRTVKGLSSSSSSSCFSS